MSDDEEIWQLAPSEEVVSEGLRRAGRKLDDLQLDEQIAVAAARRDVCAAHREPDAAELWNRAALAFHDVRRERTRTRRGFDDQVSPVQGRPMTPEELAEVDWPDEGDAR